MLMSKTGLVLAILLAPVMADPNGSPINTGEIRKTGNIEMIQKKNIRLEEERLSVRIVGDQALVQVNYRLRNLGQADRVTYGFPVDCDQAFDSDANPVDRSTLTELRITEETETGRAGRAIPIQRVVRERPGDPKEFEPYKEWHVVEIPFRDYEEKAITVSYQQKCRLEDYVYTKSFRPVFSKRTFSYSLKPARNWGDGTVANCSVLIDARELLSQGGIVEVIKPRGYTANGGIISWDHHDLDLHSAEDIEFVYDNSSSAFTAYVQKARLPRSSITDIRASSVLRTDSINRFSYGPKNLFDNDLNTAWVEGVTGSGDGEWVEIDCAGNVHIEAIGIINGYTKNQAIYNANNRIRKIRLEVQARVAWPDGTTDQRVVDIDLEEKQFNELNRNVQAPFISWLADYGMGVPVSRIRLTVLSVAGGTKYDDTCISELYLLGYIWAP